MKGRKPSMEDFLIKRLEALNSLIDESTTADDLRFAATAIKDFKLWNVNNILYIWNETTEDYKQLNKGGSSINRLCKQLTQNWFPYFSIAERNRIASELELLCFNELIMPKAQDGKIDRIFFKNGYYSLKEQKFYKKDKKFFSEFPYMKFNCNYTTDTELHPIFKDIWNWWTRNDEDNKLFLKQLVGCIIAGYPVQRIFNFYGVEASGKSLFINMLEDIIGEDFVVSTTLNSLNERFGTLQLLNKKLLVETDASTTESIDATQVKKITGSDAIIFEQKGGDIWPQKIALNVLITSNVPLNFKGEFEGLNRRLLIYTFPHSIKTFDPESVNHSYYPVPLERLNLIRERKTDNIEHFKIDVLEPFISECIRIFSDVTNNNLSFSETKEMQHAKSEVRKNMDNVLRYWEEGFTFSIWEQDDRREIYYVKSKELYQHYKNWCYDANLRPFQFFKFREKITKQFKEIDHRQVWTSKNINNIKNYVVSYTTQEKADATARYLENELKDY